ncbi:hypothetical protein [Actinocorallia sp. A-T 12471]|uniref:hypothetical protein n=1 Tax=Actinocorallia sp. A-T 12471 TaxID=3089813 RepID=UPI0029CB7CB5|nr:hypothetical protein [Actinocorallia sp. A-T 12471]MDX6739498.1 hypothetical protein [Actinocorallia sp. A-T 12471]
MRKLVAASPEPYTLRRRTGELAEGAARLAEDLAAVSVAELLSGANRTAVRQGATTAFNGMRPGPVDWFTFEDRDDDTRDWHPQGLTSACDAGRDEPAFIASWYWKPEVDTEERGVRLTFLDPQTAKYRHVLCVVGKTDGSYAPVDIHSGGIAWYGDLLYVADTTRGLRVFDLRRILDLRSVQDDVGDHTRFGRKQGKYHAYGYRFLLPQSDCWKLATTGVRCSFASVDRSTAPARLISGECGDAQGGVGRLACWNLAEDGSLTHDEGVAVPSAAYLAPDCKIQGAVSHKARWYLSQAGTGAVRGRLIEAEPDGDPEVRDYPYGPEDLTVWRAREQLWSLTEFPRRRAIYGVPL